MNHSVFLCFPGGKRKAFTVSYDDGVEQDVRLIDLMKKHGVKGTFNLNSEQFAAPGTVYPQGQVHRRMTQAQCLALYAQDGIEVAVHATKHGFLTSMPLSVVLTQVLDDRRNLESLFGGIVRGMAYPYGVCNETVAQALRACGVAYARTTRATHDFALPTDWLLLNPTCHHDDPQLFELADRFVDTAPRHTPWLFYLWGHAYEFEGHDNWARIERLLERIGGHDDVWYATNIEIYEYVRSFESLIYSANGDRVTNPTARDIYVKADDREPVCIPAGSVCFSL